jgi:hypothetical protein
MMMTDRSVLRMDIADWVLLLWKDQEFFDCAEQRGNLTVMLLDLARDILVRGKNLAQSNEGPHDCDVNPQQHACCAER